LSGLSSITNKQLALTLVHGAVIIIIMCNFRSITDNFEFLKLTAFFWDAQCQPPGWIGVAGTH